MTVETLIANLSLEDRRNALELIWASFARDSDAYTPPEWHGRVLADRLKNPSPENVLSLGEAMKDVRRRVNERRSSS
jgi:hypothetical protein